MHFRGRAPGPGARSLAGGPQVRRALCQITCDPEGIPDDRIAVAQARHPAVGENARNFVKLVPSSNGTRVSLNAIPRVCMSTQGRSDHDE
jgi:hypothetical protein